MAKNIGIDARKLTDFGIGTYIYNLIRGLAEIDDENRYVLFVGTPGRKMLSDLPDNFRLEFESAPVYSVREQLTLSWKLSRLKLDLYHATHYVLPAYVGCRAVITIHDIIHLLYPEFLPNRLAFLYAQRMIRRSLARGERIIADSNNTRTDLMEYFDTDGRKINVVYPGVSDRFRTALPAADIEEVLARHRLQRPYLLFVGNPKPHKNLDNVVRALARVVERGAFQGELVCVGGHDTSQHRVLLEAERLGISGNLRMLGIVTEQDLPAIYQGAHLFLYPTLYEGFGLPVVEAMASGVPVITSNTSSLLEIAEGYARLVDPVDVEALADAMIELLADEASRARLIDAGRERSSQFRWQSTAEQTLEVYRAALESPYPAPLTT